MFDGKKAPPVLNEADLQSPTWIKIKKHLEERIAALRVRNDNGLLDERKTASLRGQLKEAKHLATLDKPAPQTDADD